MSKVSSLKLASEIVRALIFLNLACVALFAFGILITFVAEGRLIDSLVEDGVTNPAAQVPKLRLMLAIAMLTVVPVHLILTRLSLMIEGVRRGEAFTIVNARRLRVMAWALLAVQVLDLLFGWLTQLVEDAPGWSPSVTGWLAVILLFVLAHVFEQGAAMREELDATI